MSRAFPRSALAVPWVARRVALALIAWLAACDADTDAPTDTDSPADTDVPADTDALDCVPTEWSRDDDGDGYGDPATVLVRDDCRSPGDGYIDARHDDCDDSNPAVHPVAPELCDEVDNDCDGPVDEGVKTLWGRDDDGDGYGSTFDAMLACSSQDGRVPIATRDDCDDTSAAVHPGAPEICDLRDNDCADDPPLPDAGIDCRYVDADGDGLGDRILDTSGDGARNFADHDDTTPLPPPAPGCPVMSGVRSAHTQWASATPQPPSLIVESFVTNGVTSTFSFTGWPCTDLTTTTTQRSYRCQDGALYLIDERTCFYRDSTHWSRSNITYNPGKLIIPANVVDGMAVTHATDWTQVYDGASGMDDPEVHTTTSGHLEQSYVVSVRPAAFATPLGEIEGVETNVGWWTALGPVGLYLETLSLPSVARYTP